MCSSRSRVLLFAAALGFASCDAPRRVAAPEAANVAPPPLRRSPADHELAIQRFTSSGGLVRLGVAGVGSGAVFAVSPDEHTASSPDVLGAPVSVFDAAGSGTAEILIDLDRTVRALDFSLDGSTLLVSLTGRDVSFTGRDGPAVLEVVSSGSGKVLREIKLAPSKVRTDFQRGPEGHFLADGSIVARTGEALVRFPPNASSPEKIVEVKEGAFLATSPDKRLLIVSTPSAVFLRDGSDLQRVIVERRREGDGRGTLPSAEASVTNDGAVLFDDKGSAVLRDKNGTESRLGRGQPIGLGSDHALLRVPPRRVDLIARANAKVVRSLPAFSAWLSGTGKTVFVDGGKINELQDGSVFKFPLGAVLDGSFVLLGMPPSTLAFTVDGKRVVVPDVGGVVEWDVAKRTANRRLAFPGLSEPAQAGANWDARSPYHVKGIFRSARDVFVMASAAYRLTDRGLDPAGFSYSFPKAFARKDGRTIVCVSAASVSCESHFVLEPGATQISDLRQWYRFPLSQGRGFVVAGSASEGSDLGSSRIAAHDGPSIDDIWMRAVDLHWAVPAEDGGVILTWEGAEASPRKARLRRVHQDRIGQPCSLGDLRPERNAAMTLSPDGRTVAVPIVGDELVLVEIDSCRGWLTKLPNRVLGSDYSPDGRSLAVGVADRSVVVLTVP